MHQCLFGKYTEMPLQPKVFPGGAVASEESPVLTTTVNRSHAAPLRKACARPEIESLKRKPCCRKVAAASPGNVVRKAGVTHAAEAYSFFTSIGLVRARGSEALAGRKQEGFFLHED